MNRNPCLLVVALTWLLASVLLAGAGYFVHRNRSFKKSAVTAKGTIVELIESSGSETHTKKYTPIFTYTDQDGTEHRKKSRYTSYPPIGEVGDRIEIMYDPENPSAAKIDTFFSNWGVPLILGGLGSASFVVGFVFLIILRKSSAQGKRI